METWNSGYQNLVDPETQRRLQTESMQQIESGLKSLTAGSAPVYSPSYGAGAIQPPANPAMRQRPAPTVPVSVAPARPAAPMQNRMASNRYVQPAASAFAGQGDPLAGRLPDVSGLMGYTAPQGAVPHTSPTTPGPGAGGYENRGGIYRKVEPALGFGPANPNRVPGPGQSAGTTTYTVPGVTGMGGGPGQATFQGLPKSGGSFGYVGTPETAGMTQAEATAYNVANLNRQYEAMRSRNEAYGLSGGAAPAQGGGMDVEELLRKSNPFYAPGQGYGDEVFERDRFMRNLPKGKGRRALQSRSEALKGLGDIQQGRLQALLGMAQTQQRGQAAGFDAANQRTDAQQKANQWLMDYQQRKGGQEFDRAKWASEQQRLGQLNEAQIAKMGQKPPLSTDQQKAQLNASIMQAARMRQGARNADEVNQAQSALDYLLNLRNQVYPAQPDNDLSAILAKLPSSSSR